jgi:hypothetical protein
VNESKSLSLAQALSQSIPFNHSIAMSLQRKTVNFVPPAGLSPPASLDETAVAAAMPGWALSIRTGLGLRQVRAQWPAGAEVMTARRNPGGPRRPGPPETPARHRSSRPRRRRTVAPARAARAPDRRRADRRRRTVQILRVQWPGGPTARPASGPAAAALRRRRGGRESLGAGGPAGAGPAPPARGPTAPKLVTVTPGPGRVCQAESARNVTGPPESPRPRHWRLRPSPGPESLALPA